MFEVQIKVDGSDPILKPSMTTGNKIVTKTINDVIFIPLECVQTGADSIPFVYLKSGVKQIVLLGESNENNAVVDQGIKEGTQIYLSTPENAASFKLVGTELVSIIKERENAKKEEERRIRDEADKAKENRDRGMMGREGGMREITPEMMQQFQNRRGAGGGQGGGQGRVRDTAAMRRFMNMRNQRGGAAGDTSARRRINTQPNQRTERQNSPVTAPSTVKQNN